MRKTQHRIIKVPRKVAWLTSDDIYHRLFSHAIMVTHLLRDFVPEAMSARLDCSRMERVNAKFHGGRGRRREGDIIWRIPTIDGSDFYLCILLEFQSTIDWWMVTWVMAYIGLLWQQIIRDTKLTRGTLLPAVLPVVIYNGGPRWDAPVAVSDLIGLPPGSPLWGWQPQVRYYLLDEGAFPGDELARRDGLTALLFRLENSREPDDLLAVIDEILAWFQGHPDYDALKRVFTDVVRQALPETASETVPFPEGMLEMRAMLATRIPEWQRQWKAEGEAKGKAEIVLRLLRRKFGPLSPEVETRVRAAGSDQLDEWSERLLDARELEDVFGDPTTH